MNYADEKGILDNVIVVSSAKRYNHAAAGVAAGELIKVMEVVVSKYIIALVI